MISLKPLIFFAILEILAVAVLGCGIFFWKWRALARERRAFAVACLQARQSLENAIASTPGGEEDMRGECLKGLHALFEKTDTIEPSAWSRAGEAIFRVLERQKPGEVVETFPENPPPAGLAEDDLPESGGLSAAELQALLRERSDKFDELENYKSGLTDLSGRFQRTKVVNFKLLEYLRELAAKNEKYEPLKVMAEKLQQNDYDLEIMVTALEQERNRMGPKLAMLATENGKLQRALLHYKKQVENLAPEKLDLQMTVKDLEKRLETRNKTYQRLHNKFESLRREYIILYERSNKGKGWGGSANSRNV